MYVCARAQQSLLLWCMVEFRTLILYMSMLFNVCETRACSSTMLCACTLRTSCAGCFGQCTIYVCYVMQ